MKRCSHRPGSANDNPSTRFSWNATCSQLQPFSTSALVRLIYPLLSSNCCPRLDSAAAFQVRRWRKPPFDSDTCPVPKLKLWTRIVRAGHDVCNYTSTNKLSMLGYRTPLSTAHQRCLKSCPFGILRRPGKSSSSQPRSSTQSRARL